MMINLDSLKTEPRQVKLLGVVFDVGYIPAAIDIPFRSEWARQVNEQLGDDMSPERYAEWIQDEGNRQKAVQDLAKLIAIFTQFHDESITAGRLLEECTSRQLDALFAEIVKTLQEDAQKTPVVSDDGSKKKRR